MFIFFELVFWLSIKFGALDSALGPRPENIKVLTLLLLLLMQKQHVHRNQGFSRKKLKLVYKKDNFERGVGK